MISAKGHNGTVTFDGNTITIDRSGFIARSTVGGGRKTIPLSSISGVQYKRPGGLIEGYVEFTIPGAIEHRSRRLGLYATNENGNNENAVVVWPRQRDDFDRLVEAINQALAHRHMPQPAAVPSGPPPGWYPDTQNPSITRWWDGYRWTEHIRP